MVDEPILAERLGMTVHVSSLRQKLKRLMRDYPSTNAEILEDWLLDQANARGATAVIRMGSVACHSSPTVPETKLSNSELVVAICQPHNRDRPQWLRAAAQLISRGDVDLEALRQLAQRERVGRILAELARQALRADPEHPLWSKILEFDAGSRPLRDSLVHWTRLAKAATTDRQSGTVEWRLTK